VRVGLYDSTVIGGMAWTSGRLDEASSHPSALLACPSHIFAYPKSVLVIGPAVAGTPTIDFSLTSGPSLLGEDYLLTGCCCCELHSWYIIRRHSKKGQMRASTCHLDCTETNVRDSVGASFPNHDN